MVIENWNEIELNGVKGILWDLDNTFYFYESTHRYAFEKCKQLAIESYGFESDAFDENWKKARKKVHHDLHGQGASHSRLLYAQKLYEYQFGKSSPSFALDMEETYWSSFLSVLEWRLGIKEFMEKATGLGLTMAIVTDLTAQIQMRKFIHLGLEKYVRFLITSEEAGVEKPAPGIFQLALDKLDLKAENVIMIGDSFEKDIKGAENLGIKAYWIDDNTK